MTDSTKCPVCGRTGIPDYRSGDVRCPECGSNLKVFRILDSMESDRRSKASIWKPVGIMALVAAALFAILYFTKGTTPEADAQRISMLEDSIATLNHKMGDLKSGKQETPNVVEAAAQTSKSDSPSEEAKDASSEDDGITAPPGKVVEKDGKKYYTVQKGDSWWKISQKLYKGKIKDFELAKMNGKKASEPLEIGQEVIVK